MITLSEKQRAEAKQYLEDYQTICDMLSDVERRRFTIMISAEGDDKEDFSEFQVSHKNAKVLLEAERDWTAAELKKLGIGV